MSDSTSRDVRGPGPGGEPEPRVLATDLDATFLPVTPAAEAAARRLGEHFSASPRRLVYLTGRHLASVEGLIDAGRLPRPHLLVCDVGTSLYRTGGSGRFEEVPEYRERLREIVGEETLVALRDVLRARDDLTEQEAEKQGAHKLSFYCDAGAAETLAATLGDEIRRDARALAVLWSVDPETGRGLLDVLPTGVDKGFALGWLDDADELDRSAAVYAGDSRNDLGALTGGVRGILVGNAPDRLRREVRTLEREAGLGERVYFAREPGTEGVLEGCRHFGAPV